MSTHKTSYSCHVARRQLYSSSSPSSESAHNLHLNLLFCAAGTNYTFPVGATPSKGNSVGAIIDQVTDPPHSVGIIKASQVETLYLAFDQYVSLVVEVAYRIRDARMAPSNNTCRDLRPLSQKSRFELLAISI